MWGEAILSGFVVAQAANHSQQPADQVEGFILVTPTIA